MLERSCVYWAERIDLSNACRLLTGMIVHKEFGALDMKYTLSIALLLSGLASSVSAQEISETLAKPLRATLSSPKHPIDLEFCIADAITQVGGTIPIPIHDGPDKTLMLGYGHTPKIVVVMTKVPTGTEIKIYTKSGDTDDRFTGYVRASCKI